MKHWIFSIFLILFCKLSYAKQLDKNSKEDFSDLKFYNTVKKLASEIHVDDVNSEEFIYNSLNGGLSGLDPHSEYIKPQDYLALKERIDGEFSGVGIQIAQQNQFIKVIAPIEETPAFKAGIKAGDYITHIEKESTYKMSLDTASSKMRGKIGSKVKLVVVREGKSEPIEFVIKRDKIKSKSVKEKKFADLLILRIYNFTTSTGKEVKNSLIKNKYKGIVIDLRGNPGGALNQAIAISNFFLNEGKEIVSIKSKRENKEMSQFTDLYCTNKNKNCERVLFVQNKFLSKFIATKGVVVKEDIPIVVLINGSSASASEILAGALKDNKRAIVIGESSFGKGVVQTIFPIEKGKKGAIKITTSQYYRPNGKAVQTLGIEPDIAIPHGKIEIRTSKFKDLFFQKEKDLKNHTALKQLQKTAKSSKGYSNSEQKISEYSADLQMFSAINIIQALVLSD